MSRNVHTQRQSRKHSETYPFQNNAKNSTSNLRTETQRRHTILAFVDHTIGMRKHTDNHTVRITKTMPRWQSPLAQNAPPFKSENSRLSGLVYGLKHGPNHPYGRRPQAQIGRLNATARKECGQEHAVYRS